LILFSDVGQIVDMPRHGGLFGHPSERPYGGTYYYKEVDQPATCRMPQGTRDKRLNMYDAMARRVLDSPIRTSVVGGYNEYFSIFWGFGSCYSKRKRTNYPCSKAECPRQYRLLAICIHGCLCYEGWGKRDER
jgi:hypothetical protein